MVINVFFLHWLTCQYVTSRKFPGICFFLTSEITGGADLKIHEITSLRVANCPQAVTRRSFLKKVLLEILQKLTGKHSCQSAFFNKLK